MYYLAGTAAEVDGLGSGDMVVFDSETNGATFVQLYDYIDDADSTVYLVQAKERTDEGTTTYIYRAVDITLAGLLDEDGVATQMEVNACEFLKRLATTTSTSVSGLLSRKLKRAVPRNSPISALASIQNFSGEGLTLIQTGGDDDMPNGDEATYNGNWVAFVQSRDDDGNGPISLESNAATVIADFGMAEITAELTELATLTGDIAGSTFSGERAMVPKHLTCIALVLVSSPARAVAA